MNKNMIASELLGELIQEAYEKRTEVLVQYGKAISAVTSVLTVVQPVGEEDKTGLLLVDKLNSLIQQRDYHIQAMDDTVRKLQDMRSDASNEELL